MKVVRWVVAIPSGLVLGWGAAFAVGVVHSAIGKGPSLLDSIVFFAAYVLMGFVATYTAARIAPTYRKTVSEIVWIVLAVFLLVKRGGSFAGDVAIIVGSSLGVALTPRALVRNK